MCWTVHYLDRTTGEVALQAKLRCRAERIAAYDRGYERGRRQCPHCGQWCKYKGDTLCLVSATKERVMQTGRASFVLAAGAVALVAFTGINWAHAQHTPAAVAAVQEAAPLPPEQIPQNIQ